MSNWILFETSTQVRPKTPFSMPLY